MMIVNEWNITSMPHAGYDEPVASRSVLPWALVHTRFRKTSKILALNVLLCFAMFMLCSGVNT